MNTNSHSFFSLILRLPPLSYPSLSHAPSTGNPNICARSWAAAGSEATGLVNAPVPPVHLPVFHCTTTDPFPGASHTGCTLESPGQL